MKKLIAIVMVVTLLLTLMAVPVMAKGPNGPAGKSNVGHINIVEKDNVGPDGIPDTGDETWAIIRDAGKLRYKLSGTTLDVVLNAKGLVPGDWYYVELNDKNAANWTVISPNNYSSFYAQANDDGNIHAAFSCAVTSGMAVEANVKNAEWAALLEPSTIGVPSEWAGPTGQGWDYVLYSEDTIPVP